MGAKKAKRPRWGGGWIRFDGEKNPFLSEETPGLGYQPRVDTVRSNGDVCVDVLAYEVGWGRQCFYPVVFYRKSRRIDFGSGYEG